MSVENNNNEGLLIILSGPSGVGKDKVIKGAREKQNSIRKVVTYCAERGPRPGEVEGVDYHFVTEDAFNQMIDNGEFAEYNKTPGNIKGTRRGDLEEVFEGKNVIWKIDPNRAAGIKEYLTEHNLEKLAPLCETIYLGVPSIRELWRRINERESNESREKKINRLKFDWKTWLEYGNSFDHLIINETDKLEKTVDEFLEIIENRKASGI